MNNKKIVDFAKYCPNCKYFDFNELVKPSQTDGLHYTKESHQIIAQHLAEFIKSL